MIINMKIVAFHLYNDYSGSPKVLSMVLKGLLDKGYQIDLLTSTTEGVLDNLDCDVNIRIYRCYYKFGTNKIVQLLRYIYAQIYSFLFVFRYIYKRDVILYINTLMPLGAAIAGKILNIKVLYHYHENANVKGVLYKILSYFMQRLANDIICVSEYQYSFLNRKYNVYIIPNALPIAFENECKKISKIERDRKSILMLASLKLYKGVIEFVQIARVLPQYKFELVVNDSPEQITMFINKYDITMPNNVKLWHRQSNVLPFYERASLVLNLSKKSSFIETFGLTALEAMVSGLPVIVPSVGGIAEMVIDGYNGYKIDSENLENIVAAIKRILENKKLYEGMRKNAIEYSMKFSNTNMIESIEKLIIKVSNE